VNTELRGVDVVTYEIGWIEVVGSIFTFIDVSNGIGFYFVTIQI